MSDLHRWRRLSAITPASLVLVFTPAASARDPALAPPSAAVSAPSPPSSPASGSSAARSSAAGPPRVSAFARPSDGVVRACSFSAPVCVHASAATPPQIHAEVLRAAEGALSGYRVLGLPAPLADDARGGTPAWDVYITPPGVYTGAASPAAAAPPADVYTPPADVYTHSAAPALAEHGVTIADPETEPRALDQAAAFTLLPEPVTRGCDLAFVVARHAAEALLLRLDAGAERGLVAASASYLASIVAPCAAVEAPAVDALQAEPHRAITEPRPGPAHGGLLFPMYLDENVGSRDPGRVIVSLFAIAAQRSDPASLTFQNEPDTFDALRSSLHFRKTSVDDLLLAFAVDRAFVGDRGDGQHLVATDLYGKAGRVFFEWSVPYSSLPRRLAPARPVEPTGATYLWLDLASAPADGEITFVADWELPAVFRWSLVKVGRDGAEKGRIDVAGVFGSSHVERTVVLREPLAGLVVVGANAGGLDRSLPFDPDDAPFMPHSYEVTLYGPIAAPPAPSQ